MLQTHIKKIAYAIRHKYATFNNVVIVAAFIIAAGWVWGSLGVMQRNYDLQKEVDYRRQQLELAQLQVDNLTLQNQYYQTNEYRELQARESLGLVMPGESVLILPENSEEAKASDTQETRLVVVPQENVTNLEQWLNFLFGGYSQSITGSDES
tara:strand:- start:55 stop:513 length:459 start_codon:yes stop_codon:yes gene_type:complete